MMAVGHGPSSNVSGDARSCPFAFPVVVLLDGNLLVHLDEASLGLLPEKAAMRGNVPNIQIFAESGRVWRPVSLRSIFPTGKRLFGQSLVCASYDFEEVRAFALDELRAAARAAVENDPDDLWCQVMDHEELLRTLDAAPTFRRLVEALKVAQGL
jgi:hypothetical protein